ncbi:Arc family DNA-binding protein, partial [Streptomyces mirabilis]|uniref:Arc family DNA-binding protein n=1 Tax=Streptomyces mirabilis TaxID=68239 RepID=UPI00369D8605
MIRFSLRIPADLHEQVTARAAADRRSLNSEILHLLEVALTAPRPGSPGGAPPAGAAPPPPAGPAHSNTPPTLGPPPRVQR